MASAKITRKDFLEDRQGKTFTDVANDADYPFDVALEFFSDPDRQRRMEESETHHDRAPLAGVVRELESLAPINEFLSAFHAQRSQRLRQAIGVLVRMIMERRGWQKSGKKGSLGVRSARAPQTPNHNQGGLAFWFVRAERYELKQGMPFRTVRERCKEFDKKDSGRLTQIKKQGTNGRHGKPKTTRTERP